MDTTKIDYAKMSSDLDEWAGYHNRFSPTIRSVCCMLADGWGRAPDEHTARRAAMLIREYHGGRPELCKRAVSLLSHLEK